MIGPGTGVRVYLACGVTDMRKGIIGLATLAQDVLRQKPSGGAVFAFRGRRGDRLKLLYWDGQGFCPLLQGIGARPLPLADGNGRCGPPDLGAAGDAVGRHRLAQAGLGRTACPGGMICRLKRLVFMAFDAGPW